VIGMTTGVLVGLTVVLVLAALGVGMLLARSRTPRPASPQTVGELVRQRAGDVVPAAGRTGPPPIARRAPVPPVERLKAGDAPWSRAARMMRTAPGAEWETAPRPVVPAQGVPAASTPTAHVFSDPERTPLIGIPVVREMPDAAAGPDAPAPGTPPPADPGPDAVPPPLPRVAAARDAADQVVLLRPAVLPATTPAATGSGQPVWLRVVRRDGQPVGDAVAALLDDRGAEVDATKAAGDGVAELAAPHSGQFLLVAGADGYQPRAATVTVDGRPVEVALLLPRCVAIVGVVRADGRPIRGARVVVRQEGEVVDEVSSGPDGGYRVDDLVEGEYVVTATDRRGDARRRARVREGADAALDLDLETEEEWPWLR
jgi:hypothetical protein